jgi:hypothetical protein
MDGRRDQMCLVGAYPRRHRHEGISLIDLEEFSGMFREHDRREGTERFALLDARIEPILHLRVTGVCQDGAVAEGARPHLETPLEPTDDAPFGYASSYYGNELMVAQALVAESRPIECTPDFTIAIGNAVKGMRQHRSTGMRERLVVMPQRAAQRRASI